LYLDIDINTIDYNIYKRDLFCNHEKGGVMIDKVNIENFLKYDMSNFIGKERVITILTSFMIVISLPSAIFGMYSNITRILILPIIIFLVV